MQRWQSIDVRPDGFLGKGAVLVPPPNRPDRSTALYLIMSSTLISMTPSLSNDWERSRRDRWQFVYV